MNFIFSLLSVVDNFFSLFGLAGVIVLVIVLAFGIPAIRIAWRGGR